VTLEKQDAGLLTVYTL